MKQKSQPMRICVGCGELHPKKELTRVVLSPTGEISIDLTGKAPGRGAYMAKRLERSLKHKVSEEIYESLKEQISHE